MFCSKSGLDGHLNVWGAWLWNSYVPWLAWGFLVLLLLGRYAVEKLKVFEFISKCFYHGERARARRGGVKSEPATQIARPCWRLSGARARYDNGSSCSRLTRFPPPCACARTILCLLLVCRPLRQMRGSNDSGETKPQTCEHVVLIPTSVGRLRWLQSRSSGRMRSSASSR